MRVPKTIAVLLLVGLAILLVHRVGRASAKHPDYQPKIDPSEFQEAIDNPYFPLAPGTTFRFVEKEGKHERDNEVTVTHERKTILGVSCVVVHDTVRENGELLEDTYDWYAQDKHGTVWYMGESTKEYNSKGKFSTEGSWEAGVDGAQPGIVMVAEPKPGSPYRQEYYPGHAEDMGQIIAIGETTTVPYGSFEGCVKTKEWSTLERDKEAKWYAKGIGVVREEASDGEVSTLVSMTKP